MIWILSEDMNETKKADAAGVNLGIGEASSNASGLVLTKVDKFGSLGKAGVQANDVLVSFAGKKIESAAQAQQLADQAGVDATLTASIVRNGKPMDVSVKLRAKKKALKLDIEEMDEVLERKISP